MGQQKSSVVNSAFFTCLYVVFTPFIALLFGKKEVTFKTFIAAFVAIVGIYFLSVLSEGGVFTFHVGDILLIFCAIAFALQIIWAGHFVKGDFSPLATSSVMLLSMGILSLIAIPISGESLPPSFIGITGVLFAALFSSGVCSILQLFGQRHVPSSNASIIMSLESVFAVIFCWILPPYVPEDIMSFKEIFGCLLIFAAITYIQLPQRKKSVQKKG